MKGISISKPTWIEHEWGAEPRVEGKKRHPCEKRVLYLGPRIHRATHLSASLIQDLKSMGSRVPASGKVCSQPREVIRSRGEDDGSPGMTFCPRFAGVQLSASPRCRGEGRRAGAKRKLDTNASL